MKVPYAWLREHVDVSVGPRKLGQDLTLVGLALEGLEGEGEEAVLDLDVTSNRVDCMNVYGVAREAAVIYGLPLKPLELGFTEAGPPAAEVLEVAVEAAELCPRFCARVLDVRLGPSPPWLARRLEAVGVRSISNLVDLTNYVMMEMGQPTHAFDLSLVPAGRLHVRWARPGERVTTLDGVERGLDVGVRVGVVAGPESPLALAGIMGGAASEVGAATTAVALEAAYWDPPAIRRAAKALGMHTEASHRFERGADPAGPPVALARLAHLLEKIGAGRCRPGLVERHPGAASRKLVALRSARIETVLGTPVEEARAGAILAGLGFTVGPWAGGRTEVAVPSWRSDVSREIDLVEEVARHHGLERIGAVLPPAPRSHGLTRPQRRARLLRETLLTAGFSEAINMPFGNAALLHVGKEPAVTLANPLAEGQAVLRGSLLPGLLANLRTNAHQKRRDVALFELGTVFSPGKDLPCEEGRLALLLAGQAGPGHWSNARGRAADVFDVKGALELVARRLELRDMDLTDQAGLPPHLHPGQAALVKLDGAVVGAYGALHPDLRAALELPEDVFVAEVGLSPLLERPVPAMRVEPLDRFPAVERDLSLLCDAGTSAQAVEALVRASAGPRVRTVGVVDRYDRPPVPAGKVGLGLRLRFQDRTRTLSGDEVQAWVEAAVGALRAAGVEVRSE
jgi:phenylalanyl-tRNA synthetase beta chain